MRRIGVVTTSRADYGILRPLLRRITADDELELVLVVSGSHLGRRHGSIREIEADGFPVAAEVPLFEEESDDPVAFAAGVGRGAGGFARVLADLEPEVVLVVGDRLELLGVAAAALPLRIPIAHVHGGERTDGAFDDLVRHSLTKLSHLHFASAEPHARRIVQMGEEPWRVVVSGAPALDAIAETPEMARDELERRVGMELDGWTLIATYHPSTVGDEDPGTACRALLGAIERSGLPTVFTAPNLDPGGAAVAELLDRYVSTHENARLVPSLGAETYYALLRASIAMVGNSSSGLIEAPTFRLPVVNVGARQEGRLRAANVIDAAADEEAVLDAIRRAVTSEFRQGLRGLTNPYGDCHASDRILATLKQHPADGMLLRKRFVDLDV